MPKKYHVQVKSAPPRFEPVPRYFRMEADGCLNCHLCVKLSACVYNVHRQRFSEMGQVRTEGLWIGPGLGQFDPTDNLCKGCLSCIQECRKNILSRVINPQYASLGDDYWRPDLIASIWRQAESGTIPVSGAGYRGRFCGPGFDRMWTDMSEIVRPTRDGIHGREYISTVVELGRKPARLEFDRDGRMLTEPPVFREISIPVVFDRPDFGRLAGNVRRAMARAAKTLETLAVAESGEAAGGLAEFKDRLIVRFDPDRDDPAILEGAALVELAYTDDAPARAARIKEGRPDLVTSIRLPLDETAVERTARLAREGAEVIHLSADRHGRGLGQRREDFVIDLVRRVHLRLVEESLREKVTLLVSGGVALAEHVAKIIICGADAAGVDLALLAALECRLCAECNGDCPVELDQAPEDWAAQRLVNLIGSWHSQLIEVLGAMGLREVRRLRGEVGRAMFFEDLEADNFAPLFGQRQAAALVSGNPGWDATQRLEAPPEAAFPPPPPEPRRAAACQEELTACASRYRNRLYKYKVVRTSACVACGKCAEVCAYGVHLGAGPRMKPPVSRLCRGPEVCRAQGAFCGDGCPEGAILISLDPLWQTVGDPRWTADLLAATWLQAETGAPPARDSGLEYRTGDSGGGFDRLDFAFPEAPPNPRLDPAGIDLSLPLNRRGDGRPEITIGFPVYGGGMSFGSISLATMVSRARAYKAFNSFTCTGEGGYPEALKPYDDNVITQVATGLFGVREETIQRVRIVEFKYAQGAKPGLGGHLLGDKVTPAVARMREAVEGSSLFSPFPFHSVYSVEDHKKHVDWIKMTNPRALISVKVSTPTDVDMVAVGSYYAGAHIIHIDGSYGGTGAAPDIAKKNIAMPIEYAIPKIHNFLVEEGVRDQVTLIASGGLRTAWDVAKAIALGADGAVIGTAEMVALECVRCANCESGRGCPRGIATTDPELSHLYDADWGSQRIINLFNSWCLQLQDILWRLGLRSVRDLVGRSDLLIHRDYQGRQGQ